MGRGGRTASEVEDKSERRWSVDRAQWSEKTSSIAGWLCKASKSNCYWTRMLIVRACDMGGRGSRGPQSLSSQVWPMTREGLACQDMRTSPLYYCISSRQGDQGITSHVYHSCQHALLYYHGYRHHPPTVDDGMVLSVCVTVISRRIVPCQAAVELTLCMPPVFKSSSGYETAMQTPAQSGNGYGLAQDQSFEISMKAPTSPEVSPMLCFLVHSPLSYVSFRPSCE